MSEKYDNQISIKQPILVDRIEILPVDTDPIILHKPDLIDLQIDTSVEYYVHQCNFVFDDLKFNSFSKIEEKTEIKVFGVVAKSEGVMLVFHGYVYDCKIRWNKKFVRQEIEIEAKGLPTILGKEILRNYEMIFTRGYGEVIKDLLKSFSIFDVNEVLEESFQGRVLFNDISVMDAIRQLAYIKKWCLYFEDTKVAFKPCVERKLDEPIYEDDSQFGSIKKRVM